MMGVITAILFIVGPQHESDIPDAVWAVPMFLLLLAVAILFGSLLAFLVPWAWAVFTRGSRIGFGKSVLESFLMKTRTWRGNKSICTVITPVNLSLWKLWHSEVYSSPEVISQVAI